MQIGACKALNGSTKVRSSFFLLYLLIEEQGYTEKKDTNGNNRLIKGKICIFADLSRIEERRIKKEISHI